MDQVGSWRLNNDEPLALSWVKEPTRVVGIFFHIMIKETTKKVLIKTDKYKTRHMNKSQTFDVR